MVNDQIAELEAQIYAQTMRLHELRRAYKADLVPNYKFATESGDVSLLDLFAGHTTLLMIHNMGQGCRYCTLWADGFNGVLAHLESALPVVLVSKDAPDVQRRFANERGWRFRLASHGGGPYIQEQTLQAGVENMPGAVVYEREGDEIRRTNHCVFGPGDLYCGAWHLLSLAGIGEAQWTPQYSYWRRPAQLDDGGENLPDGA